jgi:carboxyl-terminal processing protease
MTIIRTLLISVISSGALYAGIHIGQLEIPPSFFIKAHEQICHLVKENLYLQNETLENWHKECQSQAKKLPANVAIDGFIQYVEKELDKLNVSHLSVWDPKSNREMWKSETKETGMRARFIEGEYVIVQLVDDSPAMNAGIRLGDVVVSINGEFIQSASNIQFTAGTYELRRNEDVLTLEIELATLEIDESPQLIPLSQHTALLRISSFVDHYFVKEKWLKLSEKFKSYWHVIVDLRDNQGGDFTSTARALSSFFCSSKVIGNLIQPQKRKKTYTSLEDTTTQETLLQMLNKYSHIQLSTFEPYPCHRGKVTVLINSETASTAEIFAAAMKQRAETRVWGQKSSGQVVLAVWHDLILGEEYNLSIPQASFYTTRGIEIENRGVRPSKKLDYKLSDALKGNDTWIRDAKSEPF